jgi:hypothetical protein
MAGVRDFLIYMADSFAGEDGHYGCLMINSLLELSPQDQEATTLLNDLLERLEKRLIKQL